MQWGAGYHNYRFDPEGSSRFDFRKHNPKETRVAKELDCKGMPCPQPVLQCKQCLDNEAPAELDVLVDNDAARENVTRFLETKGYEVASRQEDGLWRVSGSGTGAPAGDGAPCDCEVMDDAAVAALSHKVCVFIPSETVGDGDDGLGGKLMAAFLSTLPEMRDELWRIVLVNGGVKMTVPDHPCHAGLKALADDGVDVLVCGTCLDHFGLLEAKAVGQTTNMLDVVTSLQLASKVIRV